MKRLQVPVLLVFMFGWFLSGCGGDPVPTNTDPVAVNDTATVTQGGAATTIDVLANDTDADGDTLTIKTDSVTTPNHGGTAVIAGNKITYTPPADYHGTETFQYTVSDGNGGEANATVTVTIQAPNAVPVANNDAATAIRGGAAVIINVLANDTDADNDTLTIKAGSVTAPNHGGTAGIASNKITYTPPADFSGTETFQYTVSDGNGGEATATVTVTISKKWDDPVLIEHSDNGDAKRPDISVDSQGNAFVVWDQSDSAQISIFASKFDVANGWDDDPTLLEHNSSGPAKSARIAADSIGNAYAVWRQEAGGKDHVWGNKYTANSGWDNNRTAVDTNDSYQAKSPGIGTSLNDNNHSVFVAWYRNDNSVWARRNDEAAVQIETNSSLAVDFDHGPQVAVDASGNAYVIWTQYDAGTTRHILASRYDVHDANWSVPVRVDVGAGEAVQPQIAIDASNNPIIVWSQVDSTGHNSIYAKRCTDESTCTLSRLDHHDTSDARYPQIATDASGNAFVVWWDDDGTRANIYANRYAGGGWDTAATLLEQDNYDVTAPYIGMDDHGNAYAVWGQDDWTATGWYVDINRFSSDTGTWEGRQQITTSGTGVAVPKIAVSPDGKPFIVWSQSDGAYDSIYSSRYW